MPRRSIRLPTCLQERLVPLLHLVFLPPPPSPPLIPWAISIDWFVPFSPFPFLPGAVWDPLPLSLSLSLSLPLSHHFCFIRRLLVVNFRLYYDYLFSGWLTLTVCLGVSSTYAFHHTRIITSGWIAKVQWLLRAVVEICHRQIFSPRVVGRSVAVVSSSETYTHTHSHTHTHTDRHTQPSSVSLFPMGPVWCSDPVWGSVFPPLSRCPD